MNFEKSYHLSFIIYGSTKFPIPSLRDSRITIVLSRASLHFNNSLSILERSSPPSQRSSIRCSACNNVNRANDNVEIPRVSLSPSPPIFADTKFNFHRYAIVGRRRRYLLLWPPIKSEEEGRAEREGGTRRRRYKSHRLAGSWKERRRPPVPGRKELKRRRGRR